MCRNWPGGDLTFFRVDLKDREALSAIFDAEPIDAVIHFAALKAVGESVAKPLRYYQNNVAGTLNLLELMDQHDVRKFVFSSSATVYGNPEAVPITEDAPLSAVNPYGQTKLMIEDILRDLYHSDPRWDIAILRYFNPIGAHASGQIGEDPNGVPNNLVPYLSQVAVGRLPFLRVFGADYDTPDGTGVRDYIHVVDVAIGHLRAMEKLEEGPGLLTLNLGTGRGQSVLEIVSAFERATGQEIPVEIVEPRPGDIAVSYADPTLAINELGWKAERSLDEMMTDTWRWQSQNPNGYGSPANGTE